MTGVRKTIDEALRWLTTRGLPQGGRNRPVLVHGPNQLGNSARVLNDRDAKGGHPVIYCDFEIIELYKSTRVHNVLLIEALLQSRYQHLEIGRHRLWRHVAMGNKTHRLGNFRVFLTYSTRVPGLIDASQLVCLLF